MTTTCDKCGHELQIGDYPFCKGDPANHVPSNSGVLGDECDIWIRHGLCHENGEPRHFTSKEEIKKVAKEKGMVNWVEHVPERGTDKSKHTTRWY